MANVSTSVLDVSIDQTPKLLGGLDFATSLAGPMASASSATTNVQPTIKR